MIKLPKWPLMLTSGNPVTVEQAKEIIRRTDTFFVRGFGGNDREFDKRLAERLRMTYHLSGNSFSVVTPSADEKWWESRWDLVNSWKAKWGVVDTEYVTNEWISTYFLGGPHGWCWPDGKISYEFCVGKWPTIEEVLSDWAKLAEAFPFLTLASTLMSQTEDELFSTILVEGGQARSVSGSLAHHERFPTIFRLNEEFDESHDFSLEAEHGLPSEWLDEWELRADAL